MGGYVLGVDALVLLEEVVAGGDLQVLGDGGVVPGFLEEVVLGFVVLEIFGVVGHEDGEALEDVDVADAVVIAGEQRPGARFEVVIEEGSRFVLKLLWDFVYVDLLISYSG
jgi:hypothetical protein